MRKRTFIFLALCGFLLYTFPRAGAGDLIIVPGKRAGPITRDASEQKLIRILGMENAKPSEIDVGEGFTEPGTVLFPNDPTKTAFVLWQDTAIRKLPATIWIRNRETLWRTDKGITIGTSLKTLQELNGKPLTLAGFAWDYEGTILDCNGGHLKELGMQASKELEGRTLILRLAPDSDLQGTPEYESVCGDGSFSSDNAAMKKLNPRVYEMIVQFPQR